METLAAYIPIDRCQAMARGDQLPEQTQGTAMLADISGFTPLTVTLLQELGPKRGPEELTRQLNVVYTALITEIHRYGGSVIGFSGDAVTCWFDQDDGGRAIICGLAMQQAMAPFAVVPGPAGGTYTLKMKVALATGPARRFLVGDPEIQIIDVLAGQTIDRMAAAEQQARQGEVVVDAETVPNLAARFAVGEWRPAANSLGRRYAVVSHPNASGALSQATLFSPFSLTGRLTEDQIRPWLLPPVYERLSRGREQFLAEFRLVVPLFMRFNGIDFDSDSQAAQKLDAFVRLVQNILAGYGGYLIQLTIGDKGSYVYGAFGAPLAHHDDPARAVAAALELRSVSKTFDFINPVQIGITQGGVRTGAYGGAGRLTYGVLGDEVNMAARLMSMAKPGEIMVSERIAKAVRQSYRLAQVGLVKVKGKNAPIPVSMVLERQLAAAQKPIVFFSMPLVGRERELARLTHLLTTGSLASGGIMRVQGVAGVGKSHLIAEFADQALRHGWRVVLGMCQSVDRESPYHSWRQIFRALFVLLEEHWPDENRPAWLERQIEQVSVTFKQLQPDGATRLPLLGDILGLPLPDNAATEILSPQLRQEALFSLAVDLIQAWAKDQPLLILIEDAHWLDEASRKLAMAMSRIVPTTGLVMVLIHRSPADTAPEVLPDLNRLPGYLEINLGELPAASIGELVGNRLQGPVSPLLSSFIETYAQGNPLFAETMAEALRESQAIEPRPVDGVWVLSETLLTQLRAGNFLRFEHDQWQLVANVPLTALDLGLPDTIQGLVLTRIDRLPELEKLTLKVASVIGRRFEFSLLLETHPLHLPPDKLMEVLQVLEAGSLVQIEQPAPHVAYQFKHQVIQEVAYRTLLFAQLRELHLQIATWHEAKVEAPGKLTSWSPYLPLLVHHYRYAEAPEQECYYAGLAGEQAARRFANAEAINYLSRALALTPDPDATRRCTLLLARERVYDVLGEREAQLQDLVALEGLFQTRIEPDEQLIKYQAQIALRQANYYSNTGDYAAAIVAVRRAVDLLRPSPVIEVEAEAYLHWGALLWRQGDQPAAQERLEQALTLARQGQIRRVEADSLRHLGVLCVRRQDYAAAQACFEQALRLWREMGHRYGEGVILNNLGNLHLAQNDYATAQDFYEQALQLRRETGHRHGEGVVLNNLGDVARRQGDEAAARRYFQQSLRVCREIGDREGEASGLSNLGLVALGLGDYPAAKSCYELALEIRREMGHRQGEGIALNNLGDVALHLGDYGTAKRYYHRFLAICREIGRKTLEGYALTNLGHALTGLGELTKAIPVYQQALRLRREAGQHSLAMETVAGLIRVYLAQGELNQVETLVEDILIYLEMNPLDGTDDPFWVYLTCYHGLAAIQDGRAPAFLDRAQQLLRDRAVKISDESLRRSFLENIPSHRALIHSRQASQTGS